MAEQQVQLYSMVPLLQAAEQKSLQTSFGSAIGAYNVNFYAQAAGILRGLNETDAPGIIQASSGANKFQGGPSYIRDIVMLAMADRGVKVPVALHLDHGTEEAAQKCVDDGFSSVMIDASSNPFETNIDITKRVVEYAHSKGVSVEGEYGLLAGVEEEVQHAKSVYADPKRVAAFFVMTGADALAAAYGTSHGPNKGKTDALSLQTVNGSYRAMVGSGLNLNHFLVSHGSSSVPFSFVAVINLYGGALKDTSGVPEYMVVRAIQLGMRKVNIDTDLRLAMTGEARKWLYENPEAHNGSELVAMIKGALDGTIVAYDKSGKVVPAEGITDPRSWLDSIAKKDPAILRKNYEETGDEQFIELMGIVETTVAKHVAHLNKVFGSAGLAERVDMSLTLEQMAEQYKKAD